MPLGLIADSMYGDDHDDGEVIVNQPVYVDPLFLMTFFPSGSMIDSSLNAYTLETNSIDHVSVFPYI